MRPPQYPILLPGALLQLLLKKRLQLQKRSWLHRWLQVLQVDSNRAGIHFRLSIALQAMADTLLRRRLYPMTGSIYIRG